jgi:hypothetical protein
MEDKTMWVNFVNFRSKWRASTVKDLLSLFPQTTHYGYLRLDIFDAEKNKTAYLEIDASAAKSLIGYIDTNITGCAINKLIHAYNVADPDNAASQVLLQRALRDLVEQYSHPDES